jgi:hypothetical protein
MDTPFPRLCKPQRQPVVIFNNLAALHFIFYTKEFTFATYFNKKDNSFLLKLSFGAFAGQKSAFLRGSWHYFSFKM